LKNLFRHIKAIIIIVSVSALIPAQLGVAAPEPVGQETVTPVRAEKLANVPGKTMTVVIVSYAPGGKSSMHHHAGSVFAYVLTGAIRSENSATDRLRSTKLARVFSSHPAANMSSVKMRVQLNQPACSSFSSPRTARD
jgi:hypothetical protein